MTQTDLISKAVTANQDTKMSQPNPQSERDEYDFNLHLKAGLAYSGKNEEGEDEWIGTVQHWQTYERLASEEPEDIKF